MIPSSKPQATIDEINKIIEANGIDRTKFPCVLVGIRGYYLDSMGAEKVNDRGIYDDALFWVTPNVFASFNGNTDPSKFQKGFGSGAAKGMASLNTGVWFYKRGVHYGKIPHEAFRQAAPVKITRDGIAGPYQDSLDSSINIHRGGFGTSSLGCQTVPPIQWESFKGLGYSETQRLKQNTFPYILINETERRAGNYKV
ncbi:hypothetical protein ACES2L_06090 [Bdellovibrio bacteriovorus]